MAVCGSGLPIASFAGKTTRYRNIRPETDASIPLLRRAKARFFWLVIDIPMRMEDFASFGMAEFIAMAGGTVYRFLMRRR